MTKTIDPKLTKSIEDQLAYTLDNVIEHKLYDKALETLRMVKDTFPLYNDYLLKVYKARGMNQNEDKTRNN